MSCFFFLYLSRIAKLKISRLKLPSLTLGLGGLLAFFLKGHLNNLRHEDMPVKISLQESRDAHEVYILLNWSVLTYLCLNANSHH